MTKLNMLLVAGLFAVGMSLAACAKEAEPQKPTDSKPAATDSHDDHEGHDDAAPATQPAGDDAAATQPAADAGDGGEVILVNDLCPISNHAVDKTVNVTIDGKTYGLCCEDCVEPFKEKMAAKANP